MGAEVPKGYTWADLGWRAAPQSVPREVSGDRDHAKPETVLVGPDGKTPILQRVPRPVGFRPERAR